MGRLSKHTGPVQAPRFSQTSWFMLSGGSCQQCSSHFWVKREVGEVGGESVHFHPGAKGAGGLGLTAGASVPLLTRAGGQPRDS